MKKAFDVKLNYLSEVLVSDDDAQIPKEFTINLSDLKHKLTANISTASTFITDNMFFDPSKNMRYRFKPNKKIGKRFVGEYVVGLAIIENVNLKPLLNIKINMSYDRMRANSQVKDSFNLIDVDAQVMETGQAIVFPFALFLEDASYQ